MDNPCACPSASPNDGYWCDLPLNHESDHQRYDHEHRVMHFWPREDDSE